MVRGHSAGVYHPGMSSNQVRGHSCNPSSCRSVSGQCNAADQASHLRQVETQRAAVKAADVNLDLDWPEFREQLDRLARRLEKMPPAAVARPNPPASPPVPVEDDEFYGIPYPWI